jgi:hypothetical protein
MLANKQQGSRPSTRIGFSISVLNEPSVDIVFGSLGMLVNNHTELGSIMELASRFSF